VRVMTRGGGVWTYGPCALPASIDALRRAVVRAYVNTRGVEVRPATVRCARNVIEDWYLDGRVDAVYQLRCYDDALERLPSAPSPFSSVWVDLRAARRAALVGKITEPRRTR
jgi:hypothetical protein